MNQKKHWDQIGKQYDDEIFDVYKNDQKGVLPPYFKKHGGPLKTAIDFGCGTGKAFQYLAPEFKSILGVDISTACLNEAKQHSFKNVRLRQVDLTLAHQKLPKVDFAFCCNVIMLPEIDKNIRIIRTIYNALKPGGTAIIILPSLESVLYSTIRLVQWYKTEGVEQRDIPSSEFAYYRGNKLDLLNGIVKIDKIPTKHYLAPELNMLFDQAGFTITALQKIEYAWSTEFDAPPNWLQAPFPWDWLIECRK